ncbi:hypothetical protein L211DRAFT_868496, partial [Terfezia boudieri ATCC MYA-4762]
PPYNYVIWGEWLGCYLSWTAQDASEQSPRASKAPERAKPPSEQSPRASKAPERAKPPSEQSPQASKAPERAKPPSEQSHKLCNLRTSSTSSATPQKRGYFFFLCIRRIAEGGSYQSGRLIENGE